MNIKKTIFLSSFLFPSLTSAYFLLHLHICEKFNVVLDYFPRIFFSFTYQILVLCTFVSFIYFLHVASLMGLTDVKGHFILT